MLEHVYFQTILANMCVLNRVYSLHYDYENDFILSKHIVKLEKYDIAVEAYEISKLAIPSKFRYLPDDFRKWM